VSSFYDWSEIPVAIRQSITLNTREGKAPTCGCHERGDRWWLCQYHVGTMDGWDYAEQAFTAFMTQEYVKKGTK